MGKVMEAEGASVAIREEGGRFGCHGHGRGGGRALARDWLGEAMHNDASRCSTPLDSSPCHGVVGGVE